MRTYPTQNIIESIKNIIFLTILMSGLSCISYGSLTKSEIREDLSARLSSGGNGTRAALAAIINSENEDLIARVFSLLLESDDYDTHRVIFAGLMRMNSPIENYAPDWHVYLDTYIKNDKPDDILVTTSSLVARWKEHRLVPALVRTASHPASRVRFAAYKAMDVMENDLLIPFLLKKMTSDLPMDRVRALEGVSVYPDSRFHNFLLRSLDDENKSVRIFTIRALASQPSSYNFAGAIVRKYYSDENPSVRKEVVRIVGEKGWRSQEAVVFRAISDEAASVRIAALRSLIRMENSRGASSISKQLMIETNPVVKREALDVLMELRHSGGGDGIAYLIESEPDPSLRLKAAIAAGYLRVKESVRPLVDALEGDPEESVRLEAANSLGLIGDAYAIDSLKRVLAGNKDGFNVKSAALASLISILDHDVSSSIAHLSDKISESALKSQVDRLSRIAGGNR